MSKNDAKKLTKKLDKATKDVEKIMRKMGKTTKSAALSFDELVKKLQSPPQPPMIKGVLHDFDGNKSEFEIPLTQGEYEQYVTAMTSSAAVLPDTSQQQGGTMTPVGEHGPEVFRPVHTAMYVGTSMASASGQLAQASQMVGTLANFEWDDISTIPYGAKRDGLESWECDNCGREHFYPTEEVCRWCGKKREVFAAWLE